MSAPIHELPPAGHYLAHEAGQLAGVSGQTIGQWARHGYVRSSQSDGPPRVYSYQDVAEAMVVHELRERGIDYTVIKQTIAGLRAATGNAWPLTHGRIVTTGGTVAGEDEGGSSTSAGSLDMGWRSARKTFSASPSTSVEADGPRGNIPPSSTSRSIRHA